MVMPVIVVVVIMMMMLFMVMIAGAVHVPVLQLLRRRVAHLDDLHVKVQAHAGQRMIRVDGRVIAANRGHQR